MVIFEGKKKKKFFFEAFVSRWLFCVSIEEVPVVPPGVVCANLAYLARPPSGYRAPRVGCVSSHSLSG